MVALCEGLSAGVPEVASTKTPMFGTDDGLDERVTSCHDQFLKVRTCSPGTHVGQLLHDLFLGLWCSGN